MLLLSSCFTGIESTPRISQNDVRRQQAAVRSAEEMFFDSLRPLPPQQWGNGRPQLLVDSGNRIQRVLTPASAPFEGAAGAVFTFERFEAATTLTGQDATDVVFSSKAGEYVVRVPKPLQSLDTVNVLDIPFTVDINMVARCDSMLRGRRLFVRTPLWYDGRGERVSGLRHVPVTIDSVVPGNSNYPAAVFFSLDDETDRAMAQLGNGDRRMVLMNLGADRRSSRNFAGLFAFDDPRRQYPDIKNDTWDYIKQSKVKDGMTRDECRLALGAPASIRRVPSTNGMSEMWNYTDGVYLVFDDGYLVRWRL